MMNIIRKHKKHIPFVAAALLIVLIFMPSRSKYLIYPYAESDANDALISLQANTNTEKLTVNTTIALAVDVNTQGQTINAVGLQIHYDSTMLQVQSIDTASSFCTLYTDRTVNTVNGTIDLYCGKPRPGFIGQNTLETITFQVVAYGRGQIAVDSSSTVLKNDGQGTNILHDFEKLPVSVILSE